MAHYISHGGLSDFVPMNANFGIIPSLDHRVKGGKVARYEVYAARALEALDGVMEKVQEGKQ
jgi:methylenetetrahydrofolate--tRNA-(uracil-5-)-methyltransferase